MERIVKKEEMSFVYCLAKALFANDSETSDELSFNKGDILTVLEQNPSGLIGWWLCSLNGRQGIAPANRLRLMPGMYDKTGGLGSTKHFHMNSSPQLFNNNTEKSNICDARRKSWNTFSKTKTIENNYDFPTVQKNDYDFPITVPNSEQLLYDSPKTAFVSHAKSQDSLLNTVYDIPVTIRCSPTMSSSSSVASSNNSVSSLSLSNNSSNHSSLETKPHFEPQMLYDIPREPRKLEEEEYDIPINNKPIISKKPPQLNEKLIVFNRSPLEAQELLINYENECQKYFKILFNEYIIGTKWRTTENLLNEEKVLQLKQLLNEMLLKSLFNFQTFVKQTLINGTKNTTDSQMIQKLEKLSKQLNCSVNIIENALKSINEEKNGWALNRLLVDYNKEMKSCDDQLEQLVCCSRALHEDIKHLSSLILANIKLLFNVMDKKPPIAPKPPYKMRPLPPLPPPPPKQEDEVDYDVELGHDYEDSPDYVSLESKEFFENKKMKEIDDNFQKLEIPKFYPKQVKSESRDQQLVLFYRSQIEIHFNVFKNSIELFIETVNKNHAPNVFINNSKFVIICAQKLVFIALNLFKLLENEKLKETISKVTNELVDSIGSLVMKTKLAAEHYPRQLSVQQMLESLHSVSINANHLQNAI